MTLTRDSLNRWWWDATAEPAKQSELARLVSYNSPDIEKIVKNAESVLYELLNDDRSFSGYLEDPDRVDTQVEAIFSYLRDKIDPEFTYRLEPPESFSVKHRQRIRTIDEVIRLRLGTCIDLSIFLAACIKQANLNPFIVVSGPSNNSGEFMGGHAFVGWFRIDPNDLSSFSGNRVMDESEMIRILREPGFESWKVVNATRIVRRPFCSFQDAIAEANTHLPTSTKLQKIHFALNVKESLFEIDPEYAPAMIDRQGIIDLTPEMRLHIPNYQERIGLEGHIEEWIRETGRGVFLVTGDPGSGKTALATRMISKFPNSIHHIILPQAGYDDLERFCKSLIFQIERIAGCGSNGMPLRNWHEELHRVLGKVSTKYVNENRNEKLIVFIDGLDRCWGPGGKYWNKMPPVDEFIPESIWDRVLFILTSRRENFLEKLNSTGRNLKSVDLGDWDWMADNENAIDAYLKNKIGKLSKPGYNDNFARLVTNIWGNFQLATACCEKLESRKRLLEETIDECSKEPEGWMRLEAKKLHECGTMDWRDLLFVLKTVFFAGARGYDKLSIIEKGRNKRDRLREIILEIAEKRGGHEKKYNDIYSEALAVLRKGYWPNLPFEASSGFLQNRWATICSAIVKIKKALFISIGILLAIFIFITAKNAYINGIKPKAAFTSQEETGAKAKAKDGEVFKKKDFTIESVSIVGEDGPKSSRKTAMGSEVFQLGRNEKVTIRLQIDNSLGLDMEYFWKTHSCRFEDDDSTTVEPEIGLDVSKCATRGSEPIEVQAINKDNGDITYKHFFIRID